MFVLPQLNNPYSAYEPYVDAQTMEVHHLLHHGGYVKTLNQLLVNGNIEISRIEDIFENIDTYSKAIRNMAGGHYNHTIFWSTLDDSMSAPSPELLAQINNAFGGLDEFKTEFTKIALSVFGSGWVWLVIANDGTLNIVTTENQDNPLMSDIQSGYPIFGLDVWEHAYYLKYHNRRSEYVNAIWSLVNWNILSERFSAHPEMNDLV